MAADAAGEEDLSPVKLGVLRCFFGAATLER
jgi:hypothetical protein